LRSTIFCQPGVSQALRIFLGQRCGSTTLTVETQLDFGLVAPGPRLLAPPGTLLALARIGLAVEKLNLRVACL